MCPCDRRRNCCASSTAAFVDWASFNHTLEVLHLMAEKEIVDAAHDLDHVLWEVGMKITRGPGCRSAAVGTHCHAAGSADDGRATRRTIGVRVPTSNQEGLALAKRENAQASGLGARRWRCLSPTRTLHKPLSCDFVSKTLL